MMGEKQINAMIINEKDHVIMTTETVKKGQTLCYRDTGGCPHIDRPWRISQSIIRQR